MADDMTITHGAQIASVASNLPNPEIFFGTTISRGALAIDPSNALSASDVGSKSSDPLSRA